jgi:hypothetical protein
MQNTLNSTLTLFAILFAGLVIHAPFAMAQKAGNPSGPNDASDSTGIGSNKLAGTAPAPKEAPNEPITAERISALEEALRSQKAQLDQMRKALEEQQRTIQTLAGKVASIPAPANRTTSSAEGAAGSAAAGTDAATGSTGATDSATAAEPQGVEDRLKKLEDKVLKIGPFRLSGDFRLRADAIFRSASKAPNPPLQHVQNVRARYRLRLNLDTDLYPKLSFHMQLGSGPLNNPLTMDQDFTSVVERHLLTVNEIWIDYHPTKSIQLQGGKVQEIFEDNSRFLFDDDIRFNGFNEKYVWTLEKRPLRLSSVELRAGQYILTNPNVAIIAPGSPLANAGQVVGTIGRSSNLFHQGVLFNQKFNERWSSQFGGDIQLYRNPNQIALASTQDGLVLLIQPGLGVVLSGPPPGTGTATTTPGGAIYSARSFHIARFTYRLNYAGGEYNGHPYPVTFNVQLARNAGIGLAERDAMLASFQVGKVAKHGDMSFLYLFAIKGANSMISPLTDDDLGTNSGVNIRTHSFVFEYGLAKKVKFQSLFYLQRQLHNSGDFPQFFVPLGAFAPREYRFQEQLLFTF